MAGPWNWFPWLFWCLPWILKITKRSLSRRRIISQNNIFKFPSPLRENVETEFWSPTDYFSPAAVRIGSDIAWAWPFFGKFGWTFLMLLFSVDPTGSVLVPEARFIFRSFDISYSCSPFDEPWMLDERVEHALNFPRPFISYYLAMNFISI